MRNAARFATIALAGTVALCLSTSACTSTVKSAAGAPGSTASAAGAGSVSSPASAASTTATAAPSPAKTASGSTGGALDVCSLLPVDQASSLNSVTYTAGAPQHVQAGYDVCVYHNSGQHSSPIDIQDLTVTVISMAGCWSGLEQADGPGTNIAGIGDAAFGYEIGIDVKDADRCLEISGLTANEFHGNYTPDTSMAKIILTALH